MSDRLVSRYSIARLWSEWEALETWEATLAVSYVFLAAWVCNSCSLLSIHQQSKLWPVNHYSGADIFLRDHWPPGAGVCSTRQPSLSVPSITLGYSQKYFETYI